MGMDSRARFELLYARHAAAVKAYALRRADAASADDVVAEVFVVCWRRLDELPAEELPWLFGVARRVLSTQRRGERRRAALGERLARAAPPGQESAERALGDALSCLADGDRELLLLVAWEGLSPNEAALALGVKPSTARVRLMRARRRLAAALTNERSAAPAAAEVW